MAYSWEFDAPNGVFKNRELSSKLYENALANSVAMPFVEVKSEFGKQKGDTLNFMRFQHIAEPASAELAELLPIPEVAFSMATSSFVIKEYGVAVPYTGKLEMLSKFNIEDLVQRTLMEQKRLVLDTMALKSFKLTPLKYVPTGTAASPTHSWTTNGTPSGTATLLAYGHIEELANTMYDIYRIPYHSNEEYQAIFRAKTLLQVRRDSQFLSWHQYTNAAAKAKGEVGVIERVKFVETNHGSASAATALDMGLDYKGSNNFGEGVIFGQDAVGMIEAEAPHLRAALPTGHGRFKSIAWYGLFGFNIIWASALAGEVKIVHVTSA
jgi:N4-gp56 family major capsid protein